MGNLKNHKTLRLAYGYNCITKKSQFYHSYYQFDLNFQNIHVRNIWYTLSPLCLKIVRKGQLSPLCLKIVRKGQLSPLCPKIVRKGPLSPNLCPIVRLFSVGCSCVYCYLLVSQDQ